MTHLLQAPGNICLKAFGSPLRPRVVVFMITDKCNSSCVHCSIWKQPPSEAPLSAREIGTLFKDRLFKDVEYVLCTGGEPTVRDDLKDIILAIHKVLPRAAIQISTNALMPDRFLKVVHAALDAGIRLDAGVSLDGIGEEHDKIRGVKGNFEKADSLLKELVNLRNKYPDTLSVATGIVLSDLTLNSVQKIRDYSRELNIPLTEAWYNTASFYHNLSEKSKSAFKEQMLEIVKGHHPSPLRDKWIDWIEGRSIKFPCYALNSFCVITCDGFIVPCLNLWDKKAGNVRDASPSDIWSGMEAKRVRQNVKECSGCLNTWGFGCSLESSYYQILFFYMKHPAFFVKKLFKKKG